MIFEVFIAPFTPSIIMYFLYILDNISGWHFNVKCKCSLNVSTKLNLVPTKQEHNLLKAPSFSQSNKYVIVSIFR